jgi:hypothetical protein
MPELKTVVLRKPASDAGEFEFQIATLQPEVAARLEEQLAAGGTLDPDAATVFGPAMDLSQAMHQLDARDFSVLNVPA